MLSLPRRTAAPTAGTRGQGGLGLSKFSMDAGGVKVEVDACRTAAVGTRVLTPIPKPRIHR